MPEEHPVLETVINLLSGGIAGAISRTITAPTDRIKTLMQTGQGVPLRPPGLSKSELKQKYGAFNFRRDGMIEAIKYIYSDGGIKGFWRGNGVNVIKVIPDEALKFAINVTIKERLSANPSKPTLMEHILSGAICGAVTQIFIYPLEVIKTRMTVATRGEWSSIAECIRYTSKQGFLAFYKGFIPNVAGIIPFQGTYFGLFFYLVDLYTHEHKSKPSPHTQFIYSLLASSLAVLLSYPFNLVRTKLQTQGVNGRALLYTGTIDCFEKTIEHEGFKGLYRGLMPNYLKALPSLSISLVLVKTISDFLHSKLPG